MIRPLEQFLTRRWRAAVCVLLVLGAGGLSFRLFDANSPRRAAKIYFRNCFSQGVLTERMSAEVERMGTSVAVEALAALIDEQNSRWAAGYEAFYNRVPVNLRRHLRPPLDRSRVASRSIQMLDRFGREAAPAIPALIRIYQRGGGKMDLRSPAAATLGRIGPPASNAIPVLLPDLNPTNGSLPSIIAGVLVRIDPSGDQIDRDLRQLMSQPRQEQFAAKIAERNTFALVASEGPVMWFGRDKWSAAQILGLIRSEAPRVVPVLIPLLDDKEERMRSIAAESLGRLGSAASNAIPKLQLLLDDEWAMVREAATNAIRGIDQRPP